MKEIYAMNLYELTVGSESDGERLDVFINAFISDLTRSHIQKLIKSENVRVNNIIVTKPAYKINLEDRVIVDLPDAVELKIEAQDIPLDILYEDDDVLVVNKPKGMVVHPAAGHFTDTLVNAIMFHCKDNLSGINGVLRPGIIHRIDKDTTGSLIICKNDFSHFFISEQLKEHSLGRVYKAIVIGNIKDDEGCINAPIGRHHTERKKMAVVPNGKEAITHYKVLERFPGYTFMEFRLETGRTHQIRVHMSHIGHPLLGDEVYGGKNSTFKTEGQTLHAQAISFIHPRTNERIAVEAPLPEYFNKILNKLREK